MKVQQVHRMIEMLHSFRPPEVRACGVRYSCVIGINRTGHCTIKHIFIVKQKQTKFGAWPRDGTIFFNILWPKQRYCVLQSFEGVRDWRFTNCALSETEWFPQQNKRYKAYAFVLRWLLTSWEGYQMLNALVWDPWPNAPYRNPYIKGFSQAPLK